MVMRQCNNEISPYIVLPDDDQNDDAGLEQMHEVASCLRVYVP